MLNLMLNLMRVELLKIRRSLALLMMAAIPLLVVLLCSLMLYKRPGIAQIAPEHWTMFWMGLTGMWCYFMLPLYIALITGLLNGQEHKNQTWRLMLTLPVSQYQLFLVKALLAWLFVIGASLVLVGASALAVGLFGLAGARLDAAFPIALLPVVAKASLASLPILIIQHVISWRFQNLVLPLAVGVVATMGITQIGSSAEWVWYPWSYLLMAINGSDAQLQQQALLLAGGLGAVLLLASTLWLGRREVSN